MAYAALVSLAGSLDRILDYSNSLTILLREKQQIHSLHEKTVFLLSFLEDFPREAGKLEARITIASNQAEQTVLSVYRISDENDQKWKKFCEDLGKPIEEIDSILKEVMQIRSSSGSKNSMSTLNGKDTVVGICQDLMKINDRLYGEPPALQIIPIVGMGGIGKTTLARYAHDDPSTVDHFDIRLWVTISQNSPLERILLDLLLPLGEFGGWMDNESLVVRGHRYLKGRRYLIVMDDMWDTNVWDDVRRTFPDDCNGSRIIITTRELDVASYVDSSRRPHEMHLMDVDRSWNLLKVKVFGQENCPPALEKIGKLIAQNCQGLPLAIVAIAGVLSKVNHMQDAWENIARNVVEAVNTSGELISEILSLSYTHLPRHLRPCFLYMGGFPEDYEINVSKLVILWGAEGFLISKESKDMEELGYDYLEDLAQRSLVLTKKKKCNGKIKAVKIHDVLRDLCLRKAQDENFLQVINKFSGSFPEGIENANRVSIFSYVSGWIVNVDASPVHTILLFDHWAFDSWKNFKLLRVVDAMSVTFLPSDDIRCMGELFHLTHLAFQCEAFESLLRVVAESVYQLHNLQALIVRVCSSFRRFSAGNLYMPYLEIEIWRMPQLRHLILLDGSLPDLSAESCLGISPLENLHTLSRIKDFTCSEKMLEMIPNLKKLGIFYSYEGLYESGWSKYGLNNLVRFCMLEKMSLYAEPYTNLKNDVSQNLAFPVTLKKLTLSGCRFPWEDMTVIGSLPNLEVLKLKRRACHGTEWETIDGEFCQLKVLLIDSTDLHHWITESSHFPVLERLVLYECNNLREIPDGIGEIPTLQQIEVDLRNSPIVKSAKCIEEEQQSFGNDLQVCVLKSRSWSR